MVFHDVSKYCFDWLNSQPHVKEESLTDWLLYNVSKSNSKVFYQTFTRNEEAQNGSDWEWWILTQSYGISRAYRLLVQAKKLHSNGDNYPLISYSNKNGMQIDLLIQEAKARNALPLYAFYSCCHPDINEQCRNINYISESLLKWCSNCINGCYLTSAIALHKKAFSVPRHNISEQNLVDCSFALSILDKLWDENRGAYDLLSGLNSHYTKSIENVSGCVHNYKQLPGYVKFLIERKEEDLSWLESEFRRDVGSLAGVVVLDTRQDLKESR